MKEPIVTIIMAVYNAEPYLQRCLDSLQAQTLKEFDVIIVDDGSTDHSLALAEEYAFQDSRFRVYHKENGGVSSARQYGIERLAEQGGKYSIHVDPDDWVEPQMLEQLCKRAEETEADMVICDYFKNTPNRERRHREDPRCEDPRCVLDMLFQRLHGSLCNKLIRSACYKEADIRFPEGLNFCEDFYVNVCLLRKIRKVSYLPMAFYHYDSLSNENAETKKTDSKYIDYTRTEIVRRCRELVPDTRRNWHFACFELRMAYGIIIKGSMTDKDFKNFFNNKFIALFLHPSCYSIPLFLTLLAIYTPVGRRQTSKITRVYYSLRHFIGHILKSR